MNDNSITLTRHQLYELVWQKPIHQLAREYSLSDVGFAKICKKHNIPRPPRGYWAKRASGIEVEKVPLPQPKKNDKITITPNPEHGAATKETQSLDNYFPANDIGPVIVAKKLTNPHPLIEQASDILNHSEPNDHGLLEARSENYLDIKVSSKLLPRALRIMDAVLKCFDELNFETYVKKDSTVVNIDDVEIEFGIREELKTEQKPYEFSLEGSYHFGHDNYRQVMVPSGKLRLSVHSFYSDGRLQKNWRDTERKKLEDELEKFIKGILKIAARGKEQIREQEERKRRNEEIRRRQEEERKRQEELQKQINHEKERVSNLIETASNWQKSQMLREFISAVEKAQAEGECHFTPDCSWDEWFKWAKDQADRLNPLTESPSSILDEKIERKRFDNDWRY